MLKRRPLLPLALLACVAACEGPPPPETAVSCTILKSGIVASTRVGSVADDRTTSGEVGIVVNLRVVEETRRIPVRKDVKFGLEYRFSNLPAGARVIQVLTHPPMVKPDGSTSTGSRREKEPGTAYSYALDHDYELVAGEWQIEYWYGPKRLCRQSFELYRP